MSSLLLEPLLGARDGLPFLLADLFVFRRRGGQGAVHRIEQQELHETHGGSHRIGGNAVNVVCQRSSPFSARGVRCRFYPTFPVLAAARLRPIGKLSEMQGSFSFLILQRRGLIRINVPVTPFWNVAEFHLSGLRTVQLCGRRAFVPEPSRRGRLGRCVRRWFMGLTCSVVLED